MSRVVDFTLWDLCKYPKDVDRNRAFYSSLREIIREDSTVRTQPILTSAPLKKVLQETGDYYHFEQFDVGSTLTIESVAEQYTENCPLFPKDNSINGIWVRLQYPNERWHNTIQNLVNKHFY